jgi:uncharacterized protein (TIGR03382 family)
MTTTTTTAETTTTTTKTTTETTTTTTTTTETTTDDEDGHGDDDDDDDDLATSQSGLGNREPGTPNAGCSSSGSLAPMALFALGLLVLMRRSAAIRVVATRERRKLLR